MRAARPRATSGRRVVAALALLTWVLGFELLPGWHIARHERLGPHVHGADGAVHLLANATGASDEAPRHGKVRVVASARGRARADLALPSRPHAHGSRGPGAAPEREGSPRPSPYDPRHGAGSLEHRGVATLASAIYVPTPPLEAVVPTPAPAAPVAPRATLAVRAASARAPPSGSLPSRSIRS